jgi:hypothetical protein
MIRLAFVIVSTAALFAQLDQKTNNENMVRSRGQTPVEDQRETMSRGRVGWQPMMPLGKLTVTGILIDASCEDRTSLNMRSRPLPLPPTQPSPPSSGAVAAAGISVNAQTIEKERADVMPHQVPDMRTRQEDPTCAVTAATSLYAVLTDSGRLLNLDQGGNTLMSQAISSDPRGRAMLNGQGPGIKPRIAVKGWIFDDKVIVDSVVNVASQ